ncbi:GIDE domain-containing protein [Thiopseudomonas denitrificans]|uniref:RING-type E3 ubiquitin transferase n=1 Tax=Thiopseudomonas denitrificans TaxID=1501432 RepID=A0A4R6U1K7_9GAMM|nr:GIDE domain-containing protein [Thiopseudomonas denitrificans]TDQ40220.1 E3 ubiquitin ligase [Thiopseudomonas denitrificans]
MDWLGLTVTLGITGGLCVGGGWWFVHCQRQARFLLDTPTSKIRSAAQGYVELYGFLVDSETPLSGPLSGLPCLWWSYRIEEYQRRSNNNNSSWRTLEQKSSAAMLKLDDSTGQCLIDPSGAKIIPVSRQVWHGDRRHPLAGQPQHWFSAALLGRRRYRYTEERLHAGEPLYAIGHFYSKGGGHQTLNAEAMQSAIIRQWKQDFPALLQRFDRNRDGQFDAGEWQQVRQAALQQAQQQKRQQATAPAGHFMRKPDENLPFILSSHGEDQLARKLRWKSLGGALLCIAGALASAHVLNGL